MKTFCLLLLLNIICLIVGTYYSMFHSSGLLTDKVDLPAIISNTTLFKDSATQKKTDLSQGALNNPASNAVKTAQNEGQPNTEKPMQPESRIEISNHGNSISIKSTESIPLAKNKTLNQSVENKTQILNNATPKTHEPVKAIAENPKTVTELPAKLPDTKPAHVQEKPVDKKTQVAANTVEKAKIPAKKQPECVEIGPFEISEVAQAKQLLSPLPLSTKIVQNSKLIPFGAFWVFVLKPTDEGAKNKLVSQLQAKELDFFLTKLDKTNQDVYSLGVFKSSDLAEKFQNNLKTQGLDAKLDRKQRNVIYIRLINIPDGMKSKYAAIRNKYPNATINTRCKAW